MKIKWNAPMDKFGGTVGSWVFELVTVLVAAALMTALLTHGMFSTVMWGFFCSTIAMTGLFMADNRRKTYLVGNVECLAFAALLSALLIISVFAICYVIAPATVWPETVQPLGEPHVIIITATPEGERY